MTIVVNGESRQTEAGTVNALLEELGISPERVAVELNLKVVRKCDYQSSGISEGDVVEIVNFVGGG